MIPSISDRATEVIAIALLDIDNEDICLHAAQDIVKVLTDAGITFCLIDHKIPGTDLYESQH